MPMPAVSTRDPRRAKQATLRAVLLLSGVLTVVFLISFFFSDRGIAELQHSRKQVNELRADIHRLELENARLRAEIESVKKSTFAVERIAREDLSMSKKGEIVYMLPARPAASVAQGSATPGSAAVR
jgi:cell division protein FtsB